MSAEDVYYVITCPSSWLGAIVVTPADIEAALFATRPHASREAIGILAQVLADIASAKMTPKEADNLLAQHWDAAHLLHDLAGQHVDIDGKEWTFGADADAGQIRITDTTTAAVIQLSNVQTEGGDFAAGNIDKRQGVFVDGGTFIQIGKLVVPTLPFVAIVLVLGGLLAVLVYRTFAMSTDTSDTRGPVKMQHLFNVAVADYGLVNNPSSGAVQEGDDGKLLAEWTFEKLQTRLNAIPELTGDVELQHKNVSAIVGNTPEERGRAAAQLAKQMNADVLIYGYLDTSKQPTTFIPQFYVSPRLTGAEESTGEQAFGSNVAIQRPLDQPDNRARLTNEVVPRFAALSEFMFGLAFLKAGDADKALQQFKLVQQVREWQEGQGKEILYLWIGTALVERAKTGAAADGSCPVSPSATSSGNQAAFQGDWACAQAAYEKASGPNHNFARAYIGLGNLWAEQAERVRGGLHVIDCRAYQQAAEVYKQALSSDNRAAPTAYLDLKVFYSIGHVYASAYLSEECYTQWDVPQEQILSQATQNLVRATEIYTALVKTNDIPLIRDLGAKAFYQLGLVQLQAKQYRAAVDAFAQVIAIAQPELYEEDWQQIRWIAHNQLGFTYASMAQEGERSRWSDALQNYNAVITHYKNGNHIDGVVVGDAYYLAGIANEALGDTKQAIEQYTMVSQIPGANPDIARRSQERLQALKQP
jgi:tetratricopeptide (TPR) repeat protein